MAEEPKESSPAQAVLVSLLLIVLLIGVLGWPWPRLCWDDPSFATCNPARWVKSAIQRALGG